MLTLLFLAIPVAGLVATIAYSIYSVKKGKRSPRSAFTMQLLSFLGVIIISMAAPVVASAATTDGAQDGQPQTTTSAAAEVAAASQKGIFGIAAALAVGIAGIGGGIAVAAAAPAAIGATSEDPKSFGKSMIFVALGEGIALYGLLIAILLWIKI